MAARVAAAAMVAVAVAATVVADAVAMVAVAAEAVKEAAVARMAAAAMALEDRAAAAVASAAMAVAAAAMAVAVVAARSLVAARATVALVATAAVAMAKAAAVRPAFARERARVPPQRDRRRAIAIPAWRSPILRRGRTWPCRSAMCNGRVLRRRNAVVVVDFFVVFSGCVVNGLAGGGVDCVHCHCAAAARACRMGRGEAPFRGRRPRRFATCRSMSAGVRRASPRAPIFASLEVNTSE